MRAHGQATQEQRLEELALLEQLENDDLEMHLKLEKLQQNISAVEGDRLSVQCPSSNRCIRAHRLEHSPKVVCQRCNHDVCFVELAVLQCSCVLLTKPLACPDATNIQVRPSRYRHSCLICAYGCVGLGLVSSKRSIDGAHNEGSIDLSRIVPPQHTKTLSLAKRALKQRLLQQ